MLRWKKFAVAVISLLLIFGIGGTVSAADDVVDVTGRDGESITINDYETVTLTGSAINVAISFGRDVTVTLQDLTITNDSAVVLTCTTGDVSLILEGTSSLTTGNDACIELGNCNTVVISGTGTLNVNSNRVGIQDSGDVMLKIEDGNLYSSKPIAVTDLWVTGGLVEAYGYVGAPALLASDTLTVDGGSVYGYASGEFEQAMGCMGSIVINDGLVHVESGEWAPGIGGNLYSAVCPEIIINGGTVYAEGGTGAAGIGSSALASSGSGMITVNGGTVTAIGQGSAAGIGGAGNGTEFDIVITGGTVTAIGGAENVGIGSRDDDDQVTVTITGGIVFASRGTEIDGCDIGGPTEDLAYEVSVSGTAAVFLRYTQADVLQTDVTYHTITQSIIEDGTFVGITLKDTWITDYSAYLTTCTLQYDANGGSGTLPESVLVRAGTSTLIGSAALTRSGYTVNGWNTKSDGSGISYSAGATLMLSSDITLYADWEAIAVTSVSLNHTVLDLYVGDTAGLYATVSPSNALDRTVTWSSNNISVATVSSSGVVTALGPGKAVITASADGKYARCMVNVTGFEVEILLTKGDSIGLSAKTLWDGGDDLTFVWTSSDESIATVDEDGTLTAVEIGEAKITLRAEGVSSEKVLYVQVTDETSGLSWGGADAFTVSEGDSAGTYVIEVDLTQMPEGVAYLLLDDGTLIDLSETDTFTVEEDQLAEGGLLNITVLDDTQTALGSTTLTMPQDEMTLTAQTWRVIAWILGGVVVVGVVTNFIYAVRRKRMRERAQKEK